MEVLWSFNNFVAGRVFLQFFSMRQQHIHQVENKDSCLLSQLRLAAVVRVYLLQDPPRFFHSYCALEQHKVE